MTGHSSSPFLLPSLGLDHVLRSQLQGLDHVFPLSVKNCMFSLPSILGADTWFG